MAPYVTRTVESRYRGRSLTLQLSHALFSSFDVDDGSRLLLHSLVDRVDLGSARAALDLGCGTGVIGLSIATCAPAASVLLRDRDALAAAMAADNAALNGLANVMTSAALGFQGTRPGQFDLVVSNLPAKAGRPVLESFFRGAAAALAPGGVAAFVIVAPLDALARASAAAAGLSIRWEETTPRYSVFHLRVDGAAPAPEPEDVLAPYLRDSARFAWREASWQAQTVFGLPDFDTLGRSLEPALGLLDSCQPGARVMIMNPGQGHLAMFLQARHGPGVRAMRLAARDLLALAITERNLASTGRPVAEKRPAAAESFLAQAEGAGTVDLLVIVPTVVPRAPWQPGALAAAHALLAPGGALLATSSSTEIQRLLASHDGLVAGSSRRHAGFRAALLHRR